MDRVKRVVATPARRVIDRIISVLPDRYHWELAARLPISNLGLPVAPDEDLLTSGEADVEEMLRIIASYDETFEVAESSVLDIGCGAGRLLIPMADRGARAYGIDAASGFLSECRQLAAERDVDVTLARAEDAIPAFDTDFDLVYCVKTFQSFRRRLILRYLRESYDHLRQGGLLYATFPDLSVLSNREALLTEELDDEHAFRNRYFTREEVRIYLDHLGFREVEFRNLTSTDSVRDQFAVIASK